jgi:hypothetical protein
MDTEWITKLLLDHGIAQPVDPEVVVAWLAEHYAEAIPKPHRLGRVWSLPSCPFCYNERCASVFLSDAGGVTFERHRLRDCLEHS